MSKLPDSGSTDGTVANLAEAEIILGALRWKVQPDDDRAFCPLPLAPCTWCLRVCPEQSGLGTIHCIFSQGPATCDGLTVPGTRLRPTFFLCP